MKYPNEYNNDESSNSSEYEGSVINKEDAQIAYALKNRDLPERPNINDLEFSSPREEVNSEEETAHDRFMKRRKGFIARNPGAVSPQERASVNNYFMGKDFHRRQEEEQYVRSLKLKALEADLQGKIAENNVKVYTAGSAKIEAAKIRHEEERRKKNESWCEIFKYLSEKPVGEIGISNLGFNGGEFNDEGSLITDRDNDTSDDYLIQTIRKDFPGCEDLVGVFSKKIDGKRIFVTLHDDGTQKLFDQSKLELMFENVGGSLLDWYCKDSGYISKAEMNQRLAAQSKGGGSNGGLPPNLKDLLTQYDKFSPEVQKTVDAMTREFFKVNYNIDPTSSGEDENEKNLLNVYGKGAVNGSVADALREQGTNKVNDANKVITLKGKPGTIAGSTKDGQVIVYGGDKGVMLQKDWAKLSNEEKAKWIGRYKNQKATKSNPQKPSVEKPSVGSKLLDKKSPVEDSVDDPESYKRLSFIVYDDSDSKVKPVKVVALNKNISREDPKNQAPQYKCCVGDIVLGDNNRYYEVCKDFFGTKWLKRVIKKA